MQVIAIKIDSQPEVWCQMEMHKINVNEPLMSD